MGLNMVLPLRLRRLAALDTAQIVEHLLTLNADDRHARFSALVSNQGIADYVGRINYRRDLCIGAMSPHFGLLGFIHLAFYGTSAELGASVASEWRQRGIGRALFARALRMGRALGLREIHLASGHPAARHICASLGCKVVLGDGYPRARVYLRPSAQERIAA